MGILLPPDTSWVKTALPNSIVTWGLEQDKGLERCKRRGTLESIFSPFSAPTTSSRQYCLIRQNFWRSGKGKGLFWGFQQWCEIQISFNSSWLAQVLIDFAARLPRAPSLPSPPPSDDVCAHCILPSFLSRQTLFQDPRISPALLLPSLFPSWFLSSPLCLTCAFTAVSSLSFSVAHQRWHLCHFIWRALAFSSPMFVDFPPCSQHITWVLQTIFAKLPARTESNHAGRSKSK